jgi:hypothetical protein
MARVKITKPESVDDPVIQEIFAWVTGMEGAVPNHFYVELNFPEYLKAKLGSTKVLWQMGELALPEIQHVGILVSRAHDPELWAGDAGRLCSGAFGPGRRNGRGTPAENHPRLRAEGQCRSEVDNG